MSAYCTNRDRAVEDVIDADPVASAVRTLMVERTMWSGTAADLLGTLAEAAGELVAKSKTWPNSPKALSGQLRRAATFLRKIGIDIGEAVINGRGALSARFSDEELTLEAKELGSVVAFTALI
jgi:hypothetical protein